MTEHDCAASIMRTVRFHEYGEPGDVLRLETAPVPEPGTIALLGIAALALTRRIPRRTS